MCGINGIFAYNHSASTPERRELLATRDAMTARGPDGAGEYWSEDGRLGLGHRRLSILDLTEGGSQPMVSACGRYVLVFNGEIYNYPHLRHELEAEGAAFRTNSDTEVLLHLYKRDGDRMVNRLRGMFAFAIWDNNTRSLFLARDPYGIKPLYIANDGWTFRFGSQVKALLAGGKVSRDPEPAGVVGFHLWGNVPEPFTVYRDIRALPAGHTMIVDEASPRRTQPFASISQAFAEGSSRKLTAAEISERVRDGVSESVAAHLLADVEVGIFLSGGIDSGALLGLIKDAGQKRIRAITLAFSEFRGSSDDEAPLAATIAELYGASHTIRHVGAAEFSDDLPAILHAMDQPTIDGVNTWFVAKAAREAGLKVAISGIGGDELFAGYPSFDELPHWTRMLALPAAIPGAGRGFRALMQASGRARNNPKLAGLLMFGGSLEGAYLLRRAVLLPFELSTVLDPEFVRRGMERLDLFKRLREASPDRSTPVVSRIAALESSQYMRNQLLRDADWAGMANSVEIRTPLVDWHLLKTLAPITPRFNSGAGKRALAYAASVPLPLSVVDRAKTGFNVPTGRWDADTAPLTLLPRRKTSRDWAAVIASSEIAGRSGVAAGQVPVLASQAAASPDLGKV